MKQQYYNTQYHKIQPYHPRSAALGGQKTPQIDIWIQLPWQTERIKRTKGGKKEKSKRNNELKLSFTRKIAHESHFFRRAKAGWWWQEVKRERERI